VSARYSIVSGDPRANREDLLAIATRNRPGPRARLELKYSKYYEHSPFGAPSIFLARDNESETFVGMTALFPTALRIAGELVPAAIGGDFAVDEGHRGFGPAVALQRATTAVLEERELSCAYGSPNESSEPIVARAGYADVARLTRFVKLLTAQPLAERYIRRPRLASLASTIASPVLSAVSRERLQRRSTRFSVEQPDAFDGRFSKLWELARGHQGVSSERSPELLNWRYEKTGPVEAPGKYSILALSEDGDVAAYVVYRLGDGARLVYDIQCLPDRSVIDALLAEFILDARDQRASAIDVGYVGPDTLLTERLRAFGFLPRTARNGLRVYVEEEAPNGVNLLDRYSWSFMTGDTDF
jgi:GNAT superfamily N-acetyltransferase